jgi:RimJ/RimL family protein N-acetyltransferase
MENSSDLSHFSFISISSQESISSFREMYLDDLPYNQEYYLELPIRQGNPYLIQYDDQPVGYFILSIKGTLLEYFLIRQWADQIDSLFGKIIREYSIKKALCKSFDAPLLSCCFEYQTESKPIGVLFRDYSEKPSNISDEEIAVRHASPSDEALIISVNEEVFDYPEEVMQYIRARQIFLYEKEGDLVGFGIFSHVNTGRPYRDIGMLVLPAYRHSGYGVFILHHLIHICQQNGWKVSAGCAIENIGSRRCLEKAGFIARYRLLEFKF